MIKVGDRVKAIRSVGNRHVSGATGTVAEVLDQGSILVKFDEDIGGNDRGREYWWLSARELVKLDVSEQKRKFKVDDIIIGNDRANTYAITCKGVKCRVVDVSEKEKDVIQVVVDDDTQHPTRYWVNVDCFDLVETQVPKISGHSVSYMGVTVDMDTTDVSVETALLLCIAKAKARLNYSDIQAMVFDMSTTKAGDIVKVIDAGKRYSSYFSWFDETNNGELKSRFADQFEPLRNDDKLKVVAVGKHSDLSETLYACEDIDGTIFLIGSDGVEKIK